MPGNAESPSLPSPAHFSILGYMQRRISDLVAQGHEPEALPIPTPPPHNAETGNPQRFSVVPDYPTQPEDDSEQGRISSLDQIHEWPRMTPLRSDSPLHRAGLLQPKSYNALSHSGYESNLSAARYALAPHTPDAIRLTTMQLSSLPFSSPSSVGGTSAAPNDAALHFTSGLTPMAIGSLATVVTFPGPRPISSSGTSAGTGQPTFTQDFIFPHNPSFPTASLSVTGDVRENQDVPSPLPKHQDAISKDESVPIESPVKNNIGTSDERANGSPGLKSDTGSICQVHSDESRINSPGGPSGVNPTDVQRLITPSFPNGNVNSLSRLSQEEQTCPTQNPFPRLPVSEETIPGRPGVQPSGLTLLRPSPTQPSSTQAPFCKQTSIASSDSSLSSESPTMGAPKPLLPVHPNQKPPKSKKPHVHWRDPSPLTPSERTPLLPYCYDPERNPAHTHISNSSCSGSWWPFFSSKKHAHGDENLKSHIFIRSVVDVGRKVGDRRNLRTALGAIPAVVLGCLLNVLDGVSYGMIIFPASGVFAGLGPMGVSLFFLSTIVSQLVYSLGGSGFKGANGSMMIEVVPFFHIMATSIAAEIGENHPREVIATTLVAFALSSVITGLAFFLLGALKLGVLVGFFPRHILVGCIGGVGAFLIQTGMAVSLRIGEDEFFSWNTLRVMFGDAHHAALWLIPLGLAVLLRLITHRFHHQLVFPIYFICIPVIFYIIVVCARLNLGDLRSAGWVFEMSQGSQGAWYTFYTYFDYNLVRFAPLWSTLPTQFALLFFNVLHPPLNVPALAVSLNDDVDTNKELVAHGYSNLISGLVGSVPNYLVYVNTLLFYRVGGDSRIAGLLLAVATTALLFVGTGPIAYIPILLVGALIFVLGIDLVKEALWDTRSRVSKTEYITIVSIMICMTMWDFVIGVLFGIIVSCFFFVVQNSQRRSIRTIFTGETAMSAVRRPSLQRAYIREIAKQTTVIRLQGFLFFGTITHVEETIRSLIEGPSWEHNPIQFLVVDFALVGGVDLSSAEAFVRAQRLLSAKRVILVFCGFTTESPIGQALRSVDVLGSEGVELFNTFNDAMEWTENAYLSSWFRSQKVETSSLALPVPNRLDAESEQQRVANSFVRSPRRSHLREIGDRTIAHEIHPEEEDLASEPINTLVRAFSSYGDVDPDEVRPMKKYMQRIQVPAGFVLWRQGDQSDGLYVIESGDLRATYEFANHSLHIEESMVAGTLAGELSGLSDSPRNATVVVEHNAVVWKLDADDLKRLQTDEPELSRLFVQLVLKAAKIDYDILLSSLASRQ